MKRSLFKECLALAINHLPNHPAKHYKHYSFIIQNNKIIEYGVNRYGPAYKIFGYQDHQMIHSENDAYKKARGLLSKGTFFDVVNIRLNSQGEMRNSFPCMCCLSYLKNFGCRRVYFSTNVGFADLLI